MACRRTGFARAAVVATVLLFAIVPVRAATRTEKLSRREARRERARAAHLREAAGAYSAHELQRLSQRLRRPSEQQIAQQEAEAAARHESRCELKREHKANAQEERERIDALARAQAEAGRELASVRHSLAEAKRQAVRQEAAERHRARSEADHSARATRVAARTEREEMAVLAAAVAAPSVKSPRDEERARRLSIQDARRTAARGGEEAARAAAVFREELLTRKAHFGALARQNNLLVAEYEELSRSEGAKESSALKYRWDVAAQYEREQRELVATELRRTRRRSECLARAEFANERRLLARKRSARREQWESGRNTFEASMIRTVSEDILRREREKDELIIRVLQLAEQMEQEARKQEEKEE